MKRELLLPLAAALLVLVFAGSPASAVAGDTASAVA